MCGGAYALFRHFALVAFRRPILFGFLVLDLVAIRLVI
jgi:hypothetical protein